MGKLKLTILSSVFLLGGLSLLPVGCSLTRQKAECESTSECREAFGTGYVCADTGLCELANVEAACLNQQPPDLLLAPEKYKNYVVLGSLLRPQGKEGARQDAAFLALDAFNRFLERYEDEYPELQGLRFGYVQCDHAGDVDETARLAQYLVDVIEAPAIIGPASSSGSNSAFAQVNQDTNGSETRSTLFISPSATSVALTEMEDQKPGMFWRTAPTDNGQARLMSDYALQSGEKFMAIYEDTAYGRGLYEELSSSASALCDDCGFSFDASSRAIDSLAGALASDRALQTLAEAKTVFFMGAQESHLKEMIRRLGTSDYDGKTLFFSDAGASADTVGQVEAADASRVIGTRPKAADEGESLRVFTSIYEARYDESPLIHSFTTNAYDAAWMLLISSLRARLMGDAISAASLAHGLTKISSETWAELSEEDCPGTYSSGACQALTLDSSNLEAMIKAIQDFGETDIQGASSNLDYDADTEELRDSADLFEFWHLQTVQDDDIPYSIVGGMPSSP